MEEIKYNSLELIEILESFYCYLWLIRNEIPFKDISRDILKADIAGGKVNNHVYDRDYFTQNHTSILLEYENIAGGVQQELESMYQYDFEIGLNYIKEMQEGRVDEVPITNELLYDKKYDTDYVRTLFKRKDLLGEYFISGAIRKAEFAEHLESFLFYYEKATSLKLNVFQLLEQSDIISQNLKRKYQYAKEKVLKNTGNDEDLIQSQFLKTYLTKIESDIQESSFDNDILFTLITENSFGHPQIEFKELYSNFSQYVSIKGLQTKERTPLENLAEDFSNQSWLKSFYQWFTDNLKQPNQFDLVRNGEREGTTKRTSIAFQFCILKKIGLIEEILALDTIKYKQFQKHRIIAKILGCPDDTAKKLLNRSYTNIDTIEAEAMEFLKSHDLLSEKKGKK